MCKQYRTYRIDNHLAGQIVCWTTLSVFFAPSPNFPSQPVQEPKIGRGSCVRIYFFL